SANCGLIRAAHTPNTWRALNVRVACDNERGEDRRRTRWAGRSLTWCPATRARCPNARSGHWVDYGTHAATTPLRDKWRPHPNRADGSQRLRRRDGRLFGQVELTDRQDGRSAARHRRRWWT